MFILMPFVTEKGGLKFSPGPDGKPIELARGYLFNYDPSNPITPRVLYKGAYSPARKEFETDQVLWRVDIESYDETTWDWFLKTYQRLPEIIYIESGEDIYLTNPELTLQWVLPDKVLQHLLDINKIKNPDLRKMAQERIARNASVEFVPTASKFEQKIIDTLIEENDALKTQLLTKADPKKVIRKKVKS